MNATWRNLHNRSKTGLDVVHVYSRGFGGIPTLWGQDNTRPAELRGTCERRIAKRFHIQRADLILEIVGG
jgi:hypothetical protein